MESNYSIRRMEQGDTKQLAELDKLCFAVPWSEQSFADEVQNNMANYFVAYSDERIVGYIGFWRVIDEGDITNIAVAPDYRRKGIASALLERAIREAHSFGLALLTLEVRKSNAPAQALYKAFGFKPIGERKNYYHSPQENAVIMTLMLGD